MPASSPPFTRFTGKGIRVAVVDSGIDSNHPKVGPIAGGVHLIAADDPEVLETSDSHDTAGHGTACAGIIRSKAPDVQLFAVKIFDDSLSADGRALLEAVNWCIRNRMDVVNLSLGTTDVLFRDCLNRACRTAAERGIVLVAAEENTGRVSYPASLPDVIGVAGAPFHGKWDYTYRPGHDVECAARGDEQRLCWTGGNDVLMGGTSFAAPHITAIVSLLKEQEPGIGVDEVRRRLQDHAIETAQPPANVVPLDPPRRPQPETTAPDIHRAAVYPFNKETHALVRFRDLLPFEIVAIADHVGRGCVGKDPGRLLGTGPTGLRIDARLDAALQKADTLILGCVDELGRIRQRNLLRQSIEAALAADCNVFSLLPVPEGHYPDLYSDARRRGRSITYADVTPEDLARALAPDAPEPPPVDVPVLGVFGTSSQQGKFTLQLALRRQLLNEGYRLLQLGTEPHAGLFGMDLVFPNGYASPLQFPLDWHPGFLDRELRRRCAADQPDLIIVGAQSGTIPYDVDAPDTHTLPSLAFLMGTRPDACILVVNSIDPDDYVRDTIRTLQAVAHSPTILLAISDKAKHVRTAYGRTLVSPRQMTPDEIDERLEHLEMTFGIPAVLISDEEGQRKAVERIVEYYGAEAA